MAKKKARDVIQHHHITYDPEVVVPIRQTEHWVLTQIQRLCKAKRPVTKGFIDSLRAVVALYGPRAEEVSKDVGDSEQGIGKSEG